MEYEKEFKRQWRIEAMKWYREYLKCRKMVRSLRYQNRQLRRVLYNKLKD